MNPQLLDYLRRKYLLLGMQSSPPELVNQTPSQQGWSFDPMAIPTTEQLKGLGSPIQSRVAQDIVLPDMASPPPPRLKENLEIPRLKENLDIPRSTEEQAPPSDMTPGAKQNTIDSLFNSISAMSKPPIESLPLLPGFGRASMGHGGPGTIDSPDMEMKIAVADRENKLARLEANRRMSEGLRQIGRGLVISPADVAAGRTPDFRDEAIRRQIAEEMDKVTPQFRKLLKDQLGIDVPEGASTTALEKTLGPIAGVLGRSEALQTGLDKDAARALDVAQKRAGEEIVPYERDYNQAQRAKEFLDSGDPVLSKAAIIPIVQSLLVQKRVMKVEFDAVATRNGIPGGYDALERGVTGATPKAVQNAWRQIADIVMRDAKKQIQTSLQRRKNMYIEAQQGRIPKGVDVDKIFKMLEPQDTSETNVNKEDVVKFKRAGDPNAVFEIPKDKVESMRKKYPDLVPLE